VTSSCQYKRNKSQQKFCEHFRDLKESSQQIVLNGARNYDAPSGPLNSRLERKFWGSKDRWKCNQIDIVRIELQTAIWLCSKSTFYLFELLIVIRSRTIFPAYKTERSRGEHIGSDSFVHFPYEIRKFTRSYGKPITITGYSWLNYGDLIRALCLW
jgi:hypothetical protein